MNFEFYLYIAISAGTGTAIVELLFKLFLSHWLDRLFYKFQLKIADKRKCADEILNLINSRNFKKWWDFQNDIYNKAYDISDRLITLGEKEYSKKLDSFITDKRYLKEVVDKVSDSRYGAQAKEIGDDFLETSTRLDILREELVKIAQELKK